MKKKLAGLLIFSQATQVAEAVLTLDKKNYRQHLCDDNLFAPTPSVSGANVASQIEKEIISQGYQEYCYTRSQYEDAVKDDSGYRKIYGIQSPCAGNQGDIITTKACVEKKGVSLAQSCENLRQHKGTKQNSWNELMPTIERCNNAKRR